MRSVWKRRGPRRRRERAPGSEPVAGRDVVVLCVGNPLMGDEGLGARAAELLEGQLPAGARMVVAETLGATTLPEVEGATHLLIVDAVETGMPPGTLVRLDGQNLPPCAIRLSAHTFGLADLVALLGQTSDAPEEIQIVGLQPALIRPVIGLSPVLEAAVPRLVDDVLGVLRGWT